MVPAQEAHRLLRSPWRLPTGPCVQPPLLHGSLGLQGREGLRPRYRRNERVKRSPRGRRRHGRGGRGRQRRRGVPSVSTPLSPSPFARNPPHTLFPADTSRLRSLARCSSSSRGNGGSQSASTRSKIARGSIDSSSRTRSTTGRASWVDEVEVNVCSCCRGLLQRARLLCRRWSNRARGLRWVDALVCSSASELLTTTGGLVPAWNKFVRAASSLMLTT